MSGKYRAKKIKQEHTIIDNIYPLLLKLSVLEQVQSIIPGRINHRSGSGIQPYLQLKYHTPTGVKLLAKTSSSLQEIFVVTDSPERISELLKTMNFVK